MAQTIGGAWKPTTTYIKPKSYTPSFGGAIGQKAPTTFMEYPKTPIPKTGGTTSDPLIGAVIQQQAASTPASSYSGFDMLKLRLLQASK